MTISFFAIGLLTIVSFFGAWAYDEGTINSSILASLFKVFRFPTHALFWDFFNRTAATFYSGLLLNTVFYAFLAERLFSNLKRQKAND
ncbi:hypothetical protein [Lacibacter sp.]|uniref:hypothetical protein n=1 Tax=Lacibacter sp. TaxID=1915409 RepID=UPI002B4AD6E7|nr:hypothetical protein [Lacibacter sp.]